MSTLETRAIDTDGIEDAAAAIEIVDEALSEDDIARPPIDGSVASLLEQAQEENASLQDEIISLRRDVDALQAANNSLGDANEALQKELAETSAREQALAGLFGKLGDLRVWTASAGRETVMILAPSMTEAAKTAEAVNMTDRVLLVPKPILWPDSLVKL